MGKTKGPRPFVAIFCTALATFCFPVLQAYFGFQSSEKIEIVKKKSELLKEFSQSYSQYMTMAAEYYFQECVWGDDRPIDEECRKNGLRKDELTCQRIRAKKKLIELQQPDGVLVQIREIYQVQRVKEVSNDLINKTSELAESLGCGSQVVTNATQFESFMMSLDRGYKDLLSGMAQELN